MTFFIQKVVRAPYVCTVPGGGVRAIRCYPDAKTFTVNGKHVGYSLREHTLIAPLDCSGSEMKSAAYFARHMPEILNINKR